MDENKPRRNAASVAAVILMLGLIAAVYIGGYTVLHRKVIDVNDVLNPMAIVFYEHGGCLAEPLFWPAHQADRHLRPTVWDDAPDLEITRNEFRKLLGGQK